MARGVREVDRVAGLNVIGQRDVLDLNTNEQSGQRQERRFTMIVSTQLACYRR